jgi:hypothetical protein
MGTILNRKARIVLDIGDKGATGAVGLTGATGPVGATGPAPTGTGAVIVNGGVASTLALAPGQAVVGTSTTPSAQGVQPVFNIQSFGAIGDGAHNAADTAAIIAADTAAAAAGGGVVYFPNPPAAYGITSELSPTAGNSWVGVATNDTQCILRAVTPGMRSIVAVHTTSTGSVVNATPCRFEGLTFDAGMIAPHAEIRLGDAFASYSRCFFINATLYGQRGAGHRLPMTLSIVATVPLGSPAGVTISQPDLNYSGLLAGVTTLVAKIVTPGPVGTATYQLSVNGGPFSAATQVVQPASNMCLTQGVVLATAYGPNSGIQLAFPPGPYHATDFYTVTATVSNDDPAQGSCLNELVRVRDCDWIHCGTSLATVGLFGIISGLGLNTVLAPGTVSTVAGSQIIRGDGSTTFLSLNIQEGSIIRINNEIFQITCVLDNHQIAVIGSNNAPSFTLAGLDYAIFAGAGYWEDGTSNNLMADIYDCRSQLCSNGARFGGARAPKWEGGFIGQFGGVPWIVGSSVTQMITSALLIHPYWEDGAFDGSVGITVYSTFPAVVGITVIEPLNFWTFGGNGIWRMILQSNEFGTGTNSNPTYAESLVDPVSVPITASNQHIVAPTVIDKTATSYIPLNPSAYYVLNALPTITTAGVPSGMRVLLSVVSFSHFPVTLQNQAGVGSSLQLSSQTLTIWPGEYVWFQFDGSYWVQQGPVARSFVGGSAEASGSGDGSLLTITTTSAVQPIYTWFLTNPPSTNGFVVSAMVTAKQNGSADRAFWLNVKASVGSTGALLMTSVPVANPDASGTGAGNLPPAGYALSWAIAGGVLTLNATTGANVTTAWWVQEQHASCVPVPS